MQILIDSNIVIYSLQSQQENLRKWLGNYSSIISAITQLEVLEYNGISQKEITLPNAIFQFMA